MTEDENIWIGKNAPILKAQNITASPLHHMKGSKARYRELRGWGLFQNITALQISADAEEGMR